MLGWGEGELDAIAVAVRDQSGSFAFAFHAATIAAIPNASCAKAFTASASNMIISGLLKFSDDQESIDLVTETLADVSRQPGFCDHKLTRFRAPNGEVTRYSF